MTRVTRVRRLTPPGAAGLAVIAVEGDDCAERLARLELEPPREGCLVLVRPRVRGEVLDEALVWTPAPGRVELGLHGSPPLVTEVLEVLGAESEPPAAMGLEQRAHELLAAAPGELAARILLDQAQGALRAELEAFAAGTREACELIARYQSARRFLEPARVVLAGPVNAGKSTLFNLLVGQQRVTTSEQPGTTRDVILERATLGPFPVELVDTAGDRELQGAGLRTEVERAGQELAQAQRLSADLVLWLSPAGAAGAPPSADGSSTGGSSTGGSSTGGSSTGGSSTGGTSTGGSSTGGTTLVALYTKADLSGARRADWESDWISVAEAPDQARARVLEAFVRTLAEPTDEPWVPGRGSPFEAAQVEILRVAAERPAGSARRAALVELLGA